MKIYDKKLMKYVKAIMVDMRMGRLYDFATELNNILDTKEITLMNTQTLIPFLQYRKDNPSHYDMEASALLSNGESFEHVSRTVKQLKKEHKYMLRVLSVYFTWSDESNGLFRISIKNGEVA